MWVPNLLSRVGSCYVERGARSQKRFIANLFFHIQMPTESNLKHTVELQKLEEEVIDQEDEDPLGASPDDSPKSLGMGLQSCSRLVFY